MIKPKMSRRREHKVFKKYDNGGPYHGRMERRFAKWYEECLETYRNDMISLKDDLDQLFN